MPTLLNKVQVEWLFKASENRPTLYAGKDQNPDGVGHALAQHHLISNIELGERRDSARNGSIAFFSAYITKADMIEAALETLNSPSGFWAREQLFEIAASDTKARGSHTGMRAVIQHSGQTYRVRYAGATGIIPVSSSRMCLDRIDDRILRLHVHTFYPTLDTGKPSYAEIKYRDGKQFSTWP